jgi:hypothetical protein
MLFCGFCVLQECDCGQIDVVLIFPYLEVVREQFVVVHVCEQFVIATFTQVLDVGVATTFPQEKSLIHVHGVRKLVLDINDGFLNEVFENKIPKLKKKLDLDYEMILCKIGVIKF